MVIVPVSEWIKSEMERSFLRGYDMRVIHNGKVFNIVAPLPDNRGRELVLMCREVSCEQ